MGWDVSFCVDGGRGGDEEPRRGDEEPREAGEAPPAPGEDGMPANAGGDCEETPEWTSTTVLVLVTNLTSDDRVCRTHNAQRRGHTARSSRHTKKWFVKSARDTFFYRICRRRPGL